MQFKGFTLDKFQELSAESVEKNNSVVVSAPTGSGKTLAADYIIDMDIKKGRRVIYTAPIKALSNQKYMDFCKDYGADKIGLITGDVVINPEGQVLIMTTEVYRNMAIIQDPALNDVSYCIMDEIHYINDSERGHIWEEAIIFSPDHIRFLFLSATIPNADEFGGWVEAIKKHKVDIVTHDIRAVPLNHKFYDNDLGITTIEKIREKKELESFPEMRNIHRRKKRYHKRPFVKPPDFTHLIKELHSNDKLPCIYFVFSRAKTQSYAEKLSKGNDFLKPDEKSEVMQILADEFKKINPDILTLPTTLILRQALAKGIAFHHAGMLSDLKVIIELLFSKGLTKVLFATETFAVGINMPAKTVCFDSLRKYTSSGFRFLNTKEYFQIAGRAGRRGIDKEGLSVTMIHRPSANLKAIAKITEKDVMPIKSQFKISYNTVLNLVKYHEEEEIYKILQMNFYTYQELKGKIDDNVLIKSIKARYDSCVKNLRKLKYIVDGKLSDLGLFTTKIFSDEIALSQIFGQEIKFDLDEYTILLIVAALSYEDKKKNQLKTEALRSKSRKLKEFMFNHSVLCSDKRWNNVDKIQYLIELLYHGETFVSVIEKVEILEGDLIRLLMQMLDRLEQVDRALEPCDLRDMIQNSKDLIKGCLSGFHVF